MRARESAPKPRTKFLITTVLYRPHPTHGEALPLVLTRPGEEVHRRNASASGYRDVRAGLTARGIGVHEVTERGLSVSLVLC